MRSAVELDTTTLRYYFHHLGYRSCCVVEFFIPRSLKRLQPFKHVLSEACRNEILLRKTLIRHVHFQRTLSQSSLIWASHLPGHYMFIESSAPQRHGHVAKLSSPVYKPDQMKGLCFEFFYHMFGPDDPQGKTSWLLPIFD